MTHFIASSRLGRARGTLGADRVRRILVSVSMLHVALLGPSAVQAANSIARVWDEEILAAIRIDKPHPPVHARNLFSLSAAMYDAWAVYDPVATGYVYRQKIASATPEADRREAISYASYRILRERYALSKSAATTLAALDARMVALGYDPSITNKAPSTPAGVGNAVASAVSEWFLNDGSFQTSGYADLSPTKGGYAPVNKFCNTGITGLNDSDEVTGAIFPSIVDVNRWAPLRVANAEDQNGLPTGPAQSFLGSQWLRVRPFALERNDAALPWIDPGPPPLLGTATSEEFRSNVVEVIRRSSQLTPDDGVVIDLSPGAFGNNHLGANDGTGHALNPVTTLPYAPNPTKRGDFARALAEFWADGPNSETPPGHWNSIANGVTDHPLFQKRIGGTGPVEEDLAWDVKMYFALNSALHDAACAAWSLKRKYDGWRPYAAIRYMGQLGQSSDPSLASYHTNGLPLIPDLIELVTPESSKAGGRHSGLTPGKIALLVYPGPPTNPAIQHSGIRWIHAVDWTTYQKKTFVSPAFPGYVSGHSTFSRAAAEVLAAMTGSAFFPGGLGEYTIPGGTGLTTEQGPTRTVQLQWGTYFDAADQAGISRLWGGIHPPVDDFNGRRIGAEVGNRAWDLAQRYFDGSVVNIPVSLFVRQRGPTECEVQCHTLRGFYYTLQSTLDLSLPFTNEPDGTHLALDSAVVRTDSASSPAKFYRAIRALHP